MRIGIDFDNTIVCYDSLFHKVALEQGVIPATVPVNKVAVRDYLRSAAQEPVWTELQGVVYGARLGEASIFPGALEFMACRKELGDKLNIVSHKTRHPVIGRQYDLHDAARHWVAQNLVWDGEALFAVDEVFFKPTREEKLAQIGECACDVFIDDLPEVLTACAFPNQTKAVLFDPEGHHNLPDVPTFKSWRAIMAGMDKL